MQINDWITTKIGQDIWKKKYQQDNESFDEWLNRISNGNEIIKKLIIEKKFLFGGRILASRGLQNKGRKISFSNCYVITPPEDNIESIFDCAKKLARTYSYGGGCGIDISNLAPRNAKINNAAKETSGSVSFMDLYSLVTELIGQQGRRGALMISLDCSHPDLEEFIKIKSDLNKVTKANISVRINNNFIKAIKDNEDWTLTYTRKETNEKIEKVINARELFRKLAEVNWDYAEPGILNWDRICNWNLLSEDENFKFAGVNPCVSGDTLILTENGYKRIDQLVNQSIKIWNGYQFSTVIPKITGYNQPMKKITFSDGSELNCNYYHKFILKNNKIVEAKDLYIGDKLIKCNFPIINSGKKIDKKIAYTQGFYLGDGSSEINRNRISIKLYGEKRNVINRLKYINVNYCPSFDGEFVTLLYQTNIYNKDFVPNINYDVESRLNWLAGYIDSAGTLNSIDGSISISSVNKNILIKIKQLLNTLGCNATVSEMHKEGEKLLPCGNRKFFKCQQSYRVIINATNVKKLMDLGLKTSRVKLIANPNRDDSRFIYITKIEDIGNCEIVYCFNEPLNHSVIFNGIITGQCAEEPLPAGGSCLLGSINLSEIVINPFTDNAKFDYKEFKEVVKQGIIALNEVLHEGLPLHPLDEQKESVNNWRQIGLGIFGWHDALIKLGIKYGSKESLELADKIGSKMINTAILTSALLTDKYGIYPKYNNDAIFNSKFFIQNTTEEIKKIVKEKGLSNSQLLTIAPTGSIGTMFGISTGIEPIYNISYTRKTESLHDKDEYYKIYTPIVKEYMKLKNINNEEDLPVFFTCAFQLNYKERIEMQAIWQKYIDASISSTVNIPQNFTVEEVENLYMLAWKKGLKGVTIYRSGCKRDGILVVDISSNDQNKNNIEWGTTIQSSDDLIGKKRKVITGCGSLHVLTYFDYIDGKLTEVYLSKGSQGGCNSWMVSNSRTMSASLRTGIDFDYLIDQLKSAPACPSYVTRTATKKDTSKGNCCPAAVANALIDMQNEVFDDLGIYDDDKNNVLNVNTNNICPKCGEKLQFEGGCSQCINCGYSKCD